MATLLAVAIVAAAATLVGTPSHADPTGLEHLETTHVGPRLDELRFTTPALVGETRVRVLLPAGYDDEPERRYPVLYLLHGGTGSYLDWTTQGNAEALSLDDPLIVVMPDASGYGGYIDWWNFGAGGPPMWETYHLRQLLPWIDANYRTTGDRDGRAVAGLSMGGGGSMHYAARHPDLFTAAAAFSGAVDSNTIPVQALIQTSGLQDGHLPGSNTGLRVTEEARWRGHNPWDLAENLETLFLQLDTGNGLPGGPGGDTGDPVEAGVHEMMTNFHVRLTELGYPHLWNDYGAGGHAWFYWKRDLAELLPRLMERFAHPVAPPSPFTHRSIDASYSVWGWHVAIDRPALEFSRLVGAGADGFELVGSGAATVTTAALFGPASSVAVHLDDASGTRDIVVVADATGAIAVPVSLGPGNPFQQYTLQGTLWALGAGAAPGTWPAVAARASFTPVPAAAPEAAGHAAAADADRARSGGPIGPTGLPTMGLPTTGLPTTGLPTTGLPTTGSEQSVPMAAAAAGLTTAIALRRWQQRRSR